jgi:hypothetical protein
MPAPDPVVPSIYTDNDIWALILIVVSPNSPLEPKAGLLLNALVDE